MITNTTIRDVSWLANESETAEVLKEQLQVLRTGSLAVYFGKPEAAIIYLNIVQWKLYAFGRCGTISFSKSVSVREANWLKKTAKVVHKMKNDLFCHYAAYGGGTIISFTIVD